MTHVLSQDYTFVVHYENTNKIYADIPRDPIIIHNFDTRANPATSHTYREANLK